MMNWRKNGLCFAAMLTALLLARTCWGQAAAAPKFNTASAGVRAVDVEAAVSTICRPPDITRSKDGSVSGCRVCPEGSDFRGDGHSGWEIYAETPGHFTSAHDDNLLLDGTGCDSHASNFSGSFMFALKSGAARLLKYDQGLVTEQCHKFAYADSRDFLVCRGGSTFQGESTTIIFMAYFDGSGKATIAKLISASDTNNTCLGDIKFWPAKSVEIIGLAITAMQGTTDCAAAQNDAEVGNYRAA
ncbi:MAG TPA: hypothetical protein VIH76_02280 [Candidatus Acidoferrales bacterium]